MFVLKELSNCRIYPFLFLGNNSHWNWFVFSKYLSVILTRLNTSGVEFTIHPCFSFLTALGTRNQRMASAIDHVNVHNLFAITPP